LIESWRVVERIKRIGDVSMFILNIYDTTSFDSHISVYKTNMT
jgi:hypothetical protein